MPPRLTPAYASIRTTTSVKMIKGPSTRTLWQPSLASANSPSVISPRTGPEARYHPRRCRQVRETPLRVEPA